jgi:hypothetical protein
MPVATVANLIAKSLILLIGGEGGIRTEFGWQNFPLLPLKRP